MNCLNTNEQIIQIIEAVRELPQIDPPDGFSERVMDALRAETENPATWENKDFLNIEGIIHKTKKRFKRSYIYIGATAACLLLAFLFIVSGGGSKGSGTAAQFANEAAPMVPPMPAPTPSLAAPTAPAAAPMEPEEDIAFTGIAMDSISSIASEPEYSINGEGAFRQNLSEEKAVTEVASETQSMEASEDSAVSESGGSDENVKTESPEAISQKIIKTAYYDVEVTDYDVALSELERITDAAGGFIENLSTSIYQSYPMPDGRRDLKSGYVCLRVPQTEYSGAKIMIENLGKITSTSESIDNITSRYIDTTARLEVKKAEEQRLLELYAHAEEIEDLIALETRLTYVRSDIEAMTSQLQNWNRSVSFSTVNVSIREVIDYSQVQSIDPTLGEKVKEGVNRSIAAFTRGVENFIIGIAENLIAILIFAGLTVIVLLSLFIIKRRRNKYEL